MPNTSVCVGDTIHLRVITGGYACFKNAIGEVTVIHRDMPFERATVHFTLPDGSEQHLSDIPLAYLEKVQPVKRKGVLNLHAPKDDRKEAEKQAEAKAELESWGYIVLEAGQKKSQAVCWACTYKSRQMNPHEPLKRIFCPDCKKPVYSGDTANTKGFPDWCLTRPDWPRLVACLIEWKRGPKSERQPEQVALEKQGRSVFVDHRAACYMALYRFEAEDPRLGAPNVYLSEWLAERNLLDKVWRND